MKPSFVMRATMTLLLTVLTTTGAWAQSISSVSTEKQLTDAIADGATNIQLTADIQLSKYLDIDGKTVTIDLKGYKLSRNLSEHNSQGHVIWAHNNSNLTLTSSVVGGSIEGGKANNGGAIHIPYGNMVSATNVIFKNNSAADHAGAIWNNGTFTATNCTFKNNTANDVGAIYNSKTDSGCGTANLTNCTFTDNVGTSGAGALANAVGNTVMTIDGCTIQNNTAGTYGGGIWNGGTLNMKGAVKVTDNMKASGVASNVFLKTDRVITIIGALTGSNIGVELEDTRGTFTSGFSAYNSGVNPNTIFTADLSVVLSIALDSSGEAFLTINGKEYYVERSWDATNNRVVSTQKALSGYMDYDAIPEEGAYKKVTADNGSWFLMGGYSSSVAEFYVVYGNVTLETIVVLGKNVHLILTDNSTLTLTGGLKLEDDYKLYIHCQSYDDNKMGKLIVTNKYKNAAGIGSAQDNGKDKPVGKLVIHGGHIEATGGAYGAGIGSCAGAKAVSPDLCKSVTIFGGYVKATGGESGAGIGGGSGYRECYINGGDFTLYDGTVIAQGGQYAAGIGGGGSYDYWNNATGEGGKGANVKIYGGTLTATGGENAAGIGSGNCVYYNNLEFGGKVDIYGGTVTANGGKNAAGIGGGRNSGGAKINIYNGTVIANGGEHGAGVGGGEEGITGFFKMLNGTLIANGGKGAAGIGGGYEGEFRGVTDYGLDWHETIEIAGGTVIAKAGEQGGYQNRAIGSGQKKDAFGNLALGDSMMVGAGNNGSVEHIFLADERVKACRYRSYAEISPCTHSGFTYTVSGTSANDTHAKHCRHCTKKFPEEKHVFDNGKCIVCGVETVICNVTAYVPDLEAGSGYMTLSVKMVPGTTLDLPVCNILPTGLEFAGWLVNASEVPSSYLTSEGDTLLEAETEYTVTGDVNLVARYREINIILADDTDNGETIYKYDGKLASSVTLTGRTLYKNGSWNTLCLPFALSDGDETDDVTFSGTLLEGATVLTLDNTTYGDSTLILNFKEVTAMEPGKPYLVKWAGDTEHPAIVNPVFNGVTISNIPTSEKTVSAGIITFKGLYAPLDVSGDSEDVVFYLDSDNTFCYPKDTMAIGACRAYLQINTNLGDVNCDGTVSVTDVTLIVNHILGISYENFDEERADINGDGSISVADVTALVSIIIGETNIIDVVINGAEGLNFGAFGSEPARVKMGK